jgi:hypothetical protein
MLGWIFVIGVIGTSGDNTLDDDDESVLRVYSEKRERSIEVTVIGIAQCE